MSESTTQSLPTTRRLSGPARASILGGVGLAAAVAATLVITGAGGASTVDEPGVSSSMVVEGSGASDATGLAPSSMVAEGSGASDATGPSAGAVPTDLDTVAPGYGADALVEKDVVTDGATGPSSMVAEGSGASNATGPAPASMVAEGSGASDATGYTDPATGVTVIEGDMLIAAPTTSL